ncbi:hypothetical protein HMPREF9419_1568 [Prevotella nigrescens ATCC 33563]|nr:hypothetical protein HMPREF9419_1568 [Prevotella nigrescens ATCC 33563]
MRNGKPHCGFRSADGQANDYFLIVNIVLSPANSSEFAGFLFLTYTQVQYRKAGWASNPIDILLANLLIK